MFSSRIHFFTGLSEVLSKCRLLPSDIQISPELQVATKVAMFIKAKNLLRPLVRGSGLIEARKMRHPDQSSSPNVDKGPLGS